MKVGVKVRGSGVAGSDSAYGKDVAGDWTSDLETSPNHLPSTFSIQAQSRREYLEWDESNMK